MAVEEEGLRVFQSVKIKIGKTKTKNPHPPSLSAFMDGSVLTGQAGEGDRGARGGRGGRGGLNADPSRLLL